MKTKTKPENQNGQPRMTRMARMKRNFSTEHPETRKRDFEQEAKERTEIRKAKSLFPSLTSVQICRPLSRAMSSFESALCSLRCLLFKGVCLRSSLCALCVLLWQSALAGVHYVDVNSTNATPPYTNWTTAATNIQDAVDAAVAGDQVVVTNGIYATGGRAVYGTLTNRVAVNKPLALRSVNGPQFTTIDGAGAVRCVYLTNSASLSGFTLTNGGVTLYVSESPPYRQTSGGGLWCEGTNDVVVSNCVVAGNWSWNSGGGAYGGTLNRCTMANNSSADGGGAAQSTLNNCTLVGNEAWGAFSDNYNLSAYGGGVYNCTLNNCALSSNSVSALIFGDCTSPGAGYYSYAYGGGAYGCRLNNCTLSGNSASADSEA